jgi:hypothetical protein
MVKHNSKSQQKVNGDNKKGTEGVFLTNDVPCSIYWNLQL